MKLLKQTKEYQEFANYIDDSGGNVRNLGATEKREHNDSIDIRSNEC